MVMATNRCLNHEVQFSYSVVIPTHNEIRDLEVTVAMVWASEPRPKEIIIVDDCGKDDVEKRLSSFEGIKVVRTPKRLGAGAAKRFGANIATGDVIVIMDSHMRMRYNWLHIADEAIDRYPDAIFCCGCQNFSGSWVGCGANFSRTETKTTGDLLASQKWLNKGEDEVVDRCPSLLGGCYFIPRHVWEVLGGLNHCLHGWGYEEHDLSIRSWLTGFEIRRINKLTVEHRFQRELKEAKEGFKGTYAEYNAMVVTACLFEDGVFESLFYPYFKQVSPVEAIIAFEDNIEKVNDFRSFVQAKRVYNDGDLHSLCQYRMPTHEEQRRMVDAIVERKSNDSRESRQLNRNCKNCTKELVGVEE